MRSLRLTAVSACLGMVAGLSACNIAGAADPAVASFTIRADWFDRGNIRVSLPGQAYADKYACIWNAGAVPNQSEYDIEFPIAAQYTLVALYAAAGSRPVEIHLDGRKVHTIDEGVDETGFESPSLTKEGLEVVSWTPAPETPSGVYLVRAKGRNGQRACKRVVYLK